MSDVHVHVTTHTSLFSAVVRSGRVTAVTRDDLLD